MKVRTGAAALMAVGLLAGCNKSPAPTETPSASTAASEAAQPAPAPTTVSAEASSAPEASAPLLKAASYPPQDECGKLPGWPEFRAKLEQAVARRDADALAALTDANVGLDFGGGHGMKDMRRRLDDKDYRLWEQIAKLLPLGCAVQDRGATLPWIFAHTPDDADPYSGMLVLGPAVPAYAKPDAAAPAVATLSWAIVSVSDYQGPKKPFAEIKLPGTGKTAFVETSKLRSLIDYRLLAAHGKQGWRITAIIAGD
jgi:hypothetical protein